MICIAIPTRGRPQYLEKLVTSALDMANNKSNVIIKYYLNDDDNQLKFYKNILTNLQSTYGKSVQYEIGPDQNTILSWNEMCENTEADYYMLAGDEVVFETQDWDLKLDLTKIYHTWRKNQET